MNKYQELVLENKQKSDKDNDESKYDTGIAILLISYIIYVLITWYIVYTYFIL